MDPNAFMFGFACCWLLAGLVVSLAYLWGLWLEVPLALFLIAMTISVVAWPSTVISWARQTGTGP